MEKEERVKKYHMQKYLDKNKHIEKPKKSSKHLELKFKKC